MRGFRNGWGAVWMNCSLVQEYERTRMDIAGLDAVLGPMRHSHLTHLFRLAQPYSALPGVDRNKLQEMCHL